MRRSLSLVVLASALAVAGIDRANAQNLLSNGDFELGGDILPAWTLDEFRTGDPSAEVDSASPIGFANNPGGTPDAFGLWLRAFAGNDVDGLANARLYQDVAATPGETYTFSGEALFEGNYSGGVATLDASSPLGAVPSPTESTFRLEFLDASGSVISFADTDVAADVFAGFGYSPVTPIVAVAPAGTVTARAVAEATDMVFNVDPGQSAFYDNFSLTAQSDPSTELLLNADLNAFVSGAQNFVDWDVTETPEDNDTLQIAGFANNPDSGGSQGAWIRAFLEGGSVLSQTVPAVPGSDYTLSVASRWEANYSGGDPLTSTETTLELAFLDGTDAVIGTPITLDLRTEQMNDNTWRTHTINGTAPAGAVSVRVAGITDGMVNTTGAQSAFWDDFSLTVGGGAIDGDFNGDGKVDNGDLNLLLGNWGEATVPSEWINGFDSPVDNGELNALLGNWGTGVSVAAPEPTALLLAGVGAALVRRRRS